MKPEIHYEFADVSVIVPAYQASDTITRALVSIAEQTLKPVEVVVVDDGSIDDTFEIAKAFGPHMNGIRLQVFQSKSNKGAGAARNFAIEKSSGSILAFLDADDEWLPKKLERSLAYLVDSDYSFVAHNYWTGDGDDSIHCDCVRRFREGNDAFVALYRKGYIPSCSVVAPREQVIAAGGFDPTLRNAQDFDFWLAMTRDSEATFLVFGEPLLRYHMSNDGIMGHTARRLECCLKIARRYMPDLKLRTNFALFSVWFRIAAIYLEAVCAFGKKGRFISMILTIMAFPLSLIRMTGFYFFRSSNPRGKYLKLSDSKKADEKL